MNIGDVVLYVVLGFSWGMIFTMLAERLSGDRFIGIFFPRPKPEIVMTTFEEVTDDEDNEEN